MCERGVALLNERRSLDVCHLGQSPDSSPTLIVLHATEIGNPLEVDDGGWSHAPHLHIDHEVGAAREDSRAIARGGEDLDCLRN